MRRGLAGIASVLFGCAGVLALNASPALGADLSRVMTPNSAPVTVTTASAGDNVRVKFQGLTGQVVSIATSAGTFASNCDAALSLLRPDGATVLAGPSCGGQAGAISSVTLPSDGTYQAFVDPVGASVGSVKVAVTSTTSIRSITPNAPVVGIAVPAGSSVDLGFQAAPGKYVAVQAIGDAVCSNTYRVLTPATTDLFGATCATNGAGSFTDHSTLPAAGVYKVRLTNSSGATKTVKVQIWVNSHKTGAIVLDGPPVTTANLAVGMNEARTFSGSIGTTATMDLSASTLTSYCVNLQRPNGSSLASQCFGAGSASFAATTLDSSGTWTVLIDPQVAASGQVTVELNAAPVGPGTIVIDGPVKTATISSPGTTVEWTFSAAVGQRVAMKLTASTIAGGNVSFLRPDTSSVASHFFATSDQFYEPFTVDVTGTWKVVIDPFGTETGSVTVKLTSAPDVTGSLTLGTKKTIATTLPGQLARLTFAGALNDKISTKVTGSSYPSGAYIAYYRPDGSFFSSVLTVLPGHAFADPVQLDTAGTWTVEVDPNYEDIGGLSLLLRSTPDVTGSLTLGTAHAVATTLPGQVARYTFAGALNETISTQIVSSSYPTGVWVNLYRPDGSFFGNVMWATGAASANPVQLDASGTWTVEVDAYRENVGGLSLLLSTVGN